MAYADETISTRKAVSIGLVALLHVAIGYAFVTGLAYDVMKKVQKDLTVIDVKEEPPPPEEKPPPPPPDQKIEPPPMVTPPPIVSAPTVQAPVMVQVPVPAPAPPIHIEAPPAPPPRPSVAKGATSRGSEGSWVTSDDYPSRAARENAEGVTTIAFDVGADGRATNCRVTGSSGSTDLDNATCGPFMRRARFNPAVDSSGAKIAQSGQTRRIRWQLPKD